MQTETYEQEILINGSRKIVLGIRCFPELKHRLSLEAQDLGITLSEHSENILLNKDNLKLEKENAENENETLKGEVSKLNDLLNCSYNLYEEEAEKRNKENNELRNKVIALQAQLALYNDQHLLQLFEQLQGKADTLITSTGQKLPITYNNPTDLLKAMIYSFQLKKR
jgi:cell division protein FtsB